MGYPRASWGRHVVGTGRMLNNAHRILIVSGTVTSHDIIVYTGSHPGEVLSKLLFHDYYCSMPKGHPQVDINAVQ